MSNWVKSVARPLIAGNLRIDLNRPRFDPAGQRNNVMHPGALKKCCAGEAAYAVMAIDDDERAVGRLDLVETRDQFIERDEPAVQKRCRFVFPGLTDIDEIDRFARR